MNDLEELAIKGEYKETGKSIELYISDLHIDVTYAYICSEKINKALLSTFVFYMVTFDKEAIINNLANWIKSLKRCSTLISGIAERDRIIFFDQQREMIGNL